MKFEVIKSSVSPVFINIKSYQSGCACVHAWQDPKPVTTIYTFNFMGRTHKQSVDACL